MSISTKEIFKLAKLSRLTLEEGELEKLAQELSSIINYAEKLKELDLTDVKATAHAVEVSNVFRSSGDTERDAGIIDTAIKSAPQGDIENRLFKVPKVISSGDGGAE